jgi:crotonobetainyl-CoA:carnitine CoA-transferase CaiB-like acyl-CoA transferase
MASMFGLSAAGLVSERGTNPTDTGSHFYNTYECADGTWISIAALEEKFYAELTRRLGIDAAELGGAQWDRDNWPTAQQRLAALFRSKTRAEWCELLEGTDACFAPVLSLDEAPDYPQLAARNTFVEVDGVRQPAPAPRFSRSRPDLPTPPVAPSPETADEALASWLSADDIAAAHAAGALG